MLRAFQWDLARQVERLDWLLAQLPRYADWGYNELYLHLEDAVKYPSLPGVARKDAYSHRQMGRVVDAASRVGIKVVPIVNLLGHTQYLIKVPELRDLNELRAADGSPLDTGQICPVHPRTLEIGGKLLRDIAPFCTAGKVHVGLDESFHLGKHPLSRAEIDAIGLAGHFARYVARLREVARDRNLRVGMWADMLYFLPDAIPLLPSDVATYEWYYYPFRRRPRVEFFNFAESDLGERLVARGIEYWGCPMNGAFRFEPLPHFGDRLENIRAWWQRCGRLNAAGMLITAWEPYRLAIELTTVVDAAAASLWLDGIDEPRAMLERGFARVFRKTSTRQRLRTTAGSSRMRTEDQLDAGGVTLSCMSFRPTSAEASYTRYVPAWARAAARIALACDRYPFSGYSRWEITSRWDVVSRREPIATYRREQRTFAKLLQMARRARVPHPLRASLELRWYLAVRDVFVREAQRGTARKPALQSAWRVGLAAARAMWARTRDTRVRGPNELILRDDAARIHALACDEPVLGGGWQLCYSVATLAPGTMFIAVEQRQADGAWVRRQGCHTIEFQGAVAKRRGGLTREHAAPVDWDGDVSESPTLRFVVRGIGAVRIHRVELVSIGNRIPVSPATLRVNHPPPPSPSLDFDAYQQETVVEIEVATRGNSARSLGRLRGR